MGEAMITRRAGDSFAAFITVTYPAGAVCTCVMGSKVLTAPDTSGTAVFKVRKAGTYTVTATDGSSTDSMDVVITQDGQQESVLLQFGLPLNSLPEGALIQLNENGSGVNFYLAKHDYESGLNGAGRELVVRKDCYDQRQWHSSNVNAWASCTMRTWLNGTYKGLLDAAVQEMMGNTTYYYTHGNGNATRTTRSDAVFQLSVTELGKSASYANTEGSALPIASTLQIAYRNGSAVVQWTRSPNTNGTNGVCFLGTDGVVFVSSCSNAYGSRPAFTLPATALVQPEPNADGSYTLIV